MPRLDYKTCKDCGGHQSKVGLLSHTRLCSECWKKRFLDNLDAMQTMSGPFAYHWRHQMAASVGAVLVDDLDVKP